MNSDTKTIPNSSPDAMPQASGSAKLVKLLYLLLLVAIVFTLFYYVQLKSLQSNPTKISEQKIADVVAQVEKLIDLPTGEVPTLATVNDPKALAGNAFFANVQVGDEVLFYPVAGKAFLYSPSKNMIVEVATLNIGR